MAAWLSCHFICFKMRSIHFFTEDTGFVLKQKMILRRWITLTIEENHKKLQAINYIFTSDKYLLKINKEYLGHDTLTDIITFDQSYDSCLLVADIYISVDRVKDNSKNFNNSFTDELHRVMIHGILHLLGFSDKRKSEKKEMRKRENHYLALLF